MCSCWAGKQTVVHNRGLDLNRKELVKAWKVEEQQPFIGWDFSYLDGRMVEEQPPWSYPARARVLLQQSTAVLDMGTGGGERLLELQARLEREGKLVFEARKFLIEARKVA